MDPSSRRVERVSSAGKVRHRSSGELEKYFVDKRSLHTSSEVGWLYFVLMAKFVLMVNFDLELPSPRQGGLDS